MHKIRFLTQTHKKRTYTQTEEIFFFVRALFEARIFHIFLMQKYTSALALNMAVFCFSCVDLMRFIGKMHIIYSKNKPGGAEPHASHRSGDLTPAVNISLDETILTLSGFTV